MFDRGHYHDYHRKSVKPTLIGKVESAGCKQRFHDYDNASQRFDGSEPLGYSIGSADA